ncbi:MAG: DUF3048 domain-containing protein, partial [Anaerolineales bacterium]|nr:DUF3048 domain-containing protein [Anaerolineales bacterium]
MAKTFQHSAQLILLFILATLLVACGGEESPNPVSAAEATAPVEIAAEETAVSSPATATLPPPVVPTVTLPPPAIVNNEPTPTAMPTATATPEPVAIYSAADFGTDRNPLTGERMADPSVLERRPLAIKISNNPASYTRPQHGIGQADIVFEHVTETNITRF